MEEGITMKLQVDCIPLGMMQANCYIVTDSISGSSLVIDPGECSDVLINKLWSLGVKGLDYILLTHGHFDHISGAKQLRDLFSGKIVVHGLDEEYLNNPEKSLSYMLQNPSETLCADITAADGEALPFGDEEIKVIHTPGHTPGSVCYLIGNSLFSGDTLFCLSAGRTDFPGGNFFSMKNSMKKLKKLSGDLTVYPGHDSFTTLEKEKKNNPFMREF